MAVQIIKRKYNEIYTTGETNWLLGNVGEWQELVIDIDAEIKFQGSQQTPLQIDYVQNAFILASGESWGQFGFDDGMDITFQYDLSVDSDSDGNIDVTSTIIREYTIQNILNDKMLIVENIDGDDFELMPTNFGTVKVTNVFIQSVRPIEGARISYGHLTNTNSESANLNSIIDNTKTTFALPNINAVPQGQYQFMEAIGYQSGMSIRSCEIRKVEGFAEDAGTLGQLRTFNDTFRLTPQNAGPGEFDDRDMVAFAMFVQNGLTGSVYQSVNPNVRVPINHQGEPTTIAQQGCFIHNANGDYQQDLLVDLDFRIVNTNEQSDIDNFSIVLLRFAGGTNRVFSEKTYLQTWLNAREFIGRKNSIYKVTTLNVSQGDSYALAFEYEHNNGNAYFIDIEVDAFGTIKLSNINTTFSSFGKQFFQVRLKYMISSFFENIGNFDPLEIPSFLEGEESLTDNFDIKLYPIWNNPNIVIQNDLKETKRLGNTGWFNENFNELRNDFQVESLQYFDTDGNVVDALDFSSLTKVKAVITGVPNLGSNTECGFGFSWIPTDEDDYKEKETPFYRNLFVQSGDINDGFSLDTLYQGPYLGAGISGASIDAESVKFTNSNGKIIFEANFVPNAQFFSLFDSKEDTDRNYILWVSVADGNLTRNFSDRVSLLLDFNSLEKSIPPAGAYPYIENKFIEHPGDENSIGEDNLQAIVQDDILARMPFRIKNDRSTIFQTITFGIEAYNVGLQKTFELQRYQIDLTQYPIDSNGVQQFSFDQTRGFKLVSGNNKNWVKVERNADLDTTEFNGYLAFFAFKIRWEDWIQNNDAPNDFFNSDELNNGFHNDWVAYLRTQGWVINFFSEIRAIVDGELLEYRNQWKYTFNDYDENENIQTTHQYFRDSDNTLLNIGTDPETLRPLGVILSNEPTRIEISFEILDSGTWDLSNTYGVTTIEIDRGPGQLEMRQLSSVWDSESDNPLRPLQGFTKLKMDVDGTGKILTTSCLVDPELLEDAIRYRITGRVGCGDGEGQFDTRLYENRYELTYE